MHLSQKELHLRVLSIFIGCACGGFASRHTPIKKKEIWRLDASETISTSEVRASVRLSQD